MSDCAISVENLSKSYILRHKVEGMRYVALRDVITDKVKSIGKTVLGRSSGANSQSREEFWALKDVSFQIKQGDRVGIIGRNGAGKSTLLKILSRITEPTNGRIRIRGRLSSLLEVGTGFHPELTGRENIFLNGAILGMTREEIKRKFDEIVAFAEVEKFLDTPVKRYSSGMYVRLAFAVAAHLEPEILVIDEVLAVGDVEFQKKCFGKMEDIASSGRTVLFVSHNLAAISSFTNFCCYLKNGQLVLMDQTAKALECYTAAAMQDASSNQKRKHQGGHTKIESTQLIDQKGDPTAHYIVGQPLKIRTVVNTDGAANLSLDVLLVAPSGEKLAIGSTGQFERTTLPTTAGKYVCDLVFHPLNLAAGSYSFDVATSIVNVSWDDYIESAISFDVPYCNPNNSSYDLKHSSGYGALALVCAKPVAFDEIRERSSNSAKAFSKSGS